MARRIAWRRLVFPVLFSPTIQKTPCSRERSRDAKFLKLRMTIRDMYMSVAPWRATRLGHLVTAPVPRDFDCSRERLLSQPPIFGPATKTRSIIVEASRCPAGKVGIAGRLHLLFG